MGKKKEEDDGGTADIIDIPDDDESITRSDPDDRSVYSAQAQSSVGSSVKNPKLDGPPEDATTPADEQQRKRRRRRKEETENREPKKGGDLAPAEDGPEEGT